MKNLMNNIQGLDAETKSKLMEKIMADPALKKEFLKQAEKDPKMKGKILNKINSIKAKLDFLIELLKTALEAGVTGVGKMVPQPLPPVTDKKKV